MAGRAAEGQGLWDATVMEQREGKFIWPLNGHRSL